MFAPLSPLRRTVTAVAPSIRRHCRPRMDIATGVPDRRPRDQISVSFSFGHTSTARLPPTPLPPTTPYAAVAAPSEIPGAEILVVWLPRAWPDSELIDARSGYVFLG